MVIASIAPLHLFYRCVVTAFGGHKNFMGAWMLDLCAKGHISSDSPKAILGIKYLPASHMLISLQC